MIDQSARYSILLDYYGGLLTERQRTCAQLYHDENFSLSEIADEFGISRQAVHDALKNAQTQLNTYEEKLHLGRRLLAREKMIATIDEKLDQLRQDYGCDGRLAERLEEISQIIDTLEEED